MEQFWKEWFAVASTKLRLCFLQGLRVQGRFITMILPTSLPPPPAASTPFIPPLLCKKDSRISNLFQCFYKESLADSIKMTKVLHSMKER